MRFLVVLLLTASMWGQQRTVTLEWDAPLDLDSIVGYHIYHVQGSETLYQRVTPTPVVGLMYAHTLDLPPLVEQRWVATSINDVGNESVFSNEAVYEWACPGDANIDGSIDVADVTSIRRHITGLSLLDGLGLSAADVNGDASVDVADVVSLRLHIIGIQPLEPCP